jgi:type II secretory pathway component PulC
MADVTDSMTPEIQERWVRGLAAAVWVGVAALAMAWLLWSWPLVKKSFTLKVINEYFAGHAPAPGARGVAQGGGSLAWPPAVAPAADDWNVLRRAKGKGGVTVVTAPLQRFRLAGTFTASEDGATSRRAVIDDLQKNGEYLLREGEAVEGLTLLKIFADRVLVNVGGKEEELRLSFIDTFAASAAPAAATNTTEVVLSTSRFGKRIAQDRWVLSREALMQYYEELRKDPERVLQLFDSMQPAYTPEKHISGYKLHMEGEKEFFSAAGLQEGDVVRKVNSMNMTSQKRAEYFIGEFLQNRVTALVFDIERENKAQKLIYFIR